MFSKLQFPGSPDCFERCDYLLWNIIYINTHTSCSLASLHAHHEVRHTQYSTPTIDGKRDNKIFRSYSKESGSFPPIFCPAVNTTPLFSPYIRNHPASAEIPK